MDMASFAFTVGISAKREAPDVATFDESIAEGAMDEEKGATDGCLAAGRKLTGKVNEAMDMQSPLRMLVAGYQIPLFNSYVLAAYLVSSNYV